MYIFGYSFVSKIFIQIYSDIYSYHFLGTNMFGYSFVSKSIRMSHSAMQEVEKASTALLYVHQEWCVVFWHNHVWDLHHWRESLWPPKDEEQRSQGKIVDWIWVSILNFYSTDGWVVMFNWFVKGWHIWIMAFQNIY